MDAGAGRVFIVAIDPLAFRDAPRATGHDELRAYTLPK
jgi:hypothetical protein